MNRYERELSLPSLPDMVFADNMLQLRHREGGSITFTALDALRCVNPKESSVQVAHAAVWREARLERERERVGGTVISISIVISIFLKDWHLNGAFYLTTLYFPLGQILHT